MIVQNIKDIKSRIEKAAMKVGRDPRTVELIAVSKTYPIEAICEAIEGGCTAFGENKVQELIGKIPAIQSVVDWHLIGHLQTNKVKYIVDQVALIHSVDSLKLAEEIQKQAMKKNLLVSILIEVNVAKEVSKNGVAVEEVEGLVREIGKLPNVKMRGFMTVAPYVADPEQNREIFRNLYNLSVDIQKQNIDNISTEILSMGMSTDYEIAIEEGATMVRVGTALFGKRDYTKAPKEE